MGSQREGEPKAGQQPAKLTPTDIRVIGI